MIVSDIMLFDYAPSGTKSILKLKRFMLVLFYNMTSVEMKSALKTILKYSFYCDIEKIWTKVTNVTLATTSFEWRHKWSAAPTDCSRSIYQSLFSFGFSFSTFIVIFSPKLLTVYKSTNIEWYRTHDAICSGVLFVCFCCCYCYRCFVLFCSFVYLFAFCFLRSIFRMGVYFLSWRS